MEVYNEQKFNFVRKKRRIAKVQKTEDKERDKYYEMMSMMDHVRFFMIIYPPTYSLTDPQYPHSVVAKFPKHLVVV